MVISNRNLVNLLFICSENEFKSLILLKLIYALYTPIMYSMLENKKFIAVEVSYLSADYYGGKYEGDS
jgi:hypothetical protein